jgi:hypothetical protein
MNEFHTTYNQEQILYRHEMQKKHRMIQENLEINMQTLTQDLYHILKKVSDLVPSDKDS